MSLLDRLLGRPTPAQAWANRCTTLVFYALDAADAEPSGRTPSLVLELLDPVDAEALFAATPAPQRTTVDAAAFEGVIAQAIAAPKRDPNSRGRVEFVRRWFMDQAPGWVTWQREPPEMAGVGVAAAEAAAAGA